MNRKDIRHEQTATAINADGKGKEGKWNMNDIFRFPYSSANGGFHAVSTFLEQERVTIVAPANSSAGSLKTQNIKSLSPNTIIVSIRSKAMNATSTHRTGRAALFALVLLLITTAAFSQNILVTTATSVTGTGTIKLAGHLIDSSTTAKTLGGILQLTGTSTTQNIGTGLANGLTIDSLVMAGTTDTALLGQNISVDSLAVNSGLLTVNNKTLTIAGKTSHSGGSLVANAASDSVAYTSGSAQKLVDATYTKLSMSGAGAKSLNGTVSAGTVNHSSGALTVDNPFTVTTSGAFGTVADVTSTLTINGSTTNSITTLSNVSTGTVTNGSSNTLTIGTVTTTGASGTISTSAADLTITTLSGNNGTIKTSGAGNLNFTNGATNAGVITDSVGSA